MTAATNGVWLEATLIVDGDKVAVLLDPASSARVLRARAAAVEARRSQLHRTVAHFITQHPGATANAVYKALGGRRADVLAAVRAIRECP